MKLSAVEPLWHLYTCHRKDTANTSKKCIYSSDMIRPKCVNWQSDRNSLDKDHGLSFEILNTTRKNIQKRKHMSDFRKHTQMQLELAPFVNFVWRMVLEFAFLFHFRYHSLVVLLDWLRKKRPPIHVTSDRKRPSVNMCPTQLLVSGWRWHWHNMLLAEARLGLHSL